jgi:hypothetical protein
MTQTAIPLSDPSGKSYTWNFEKRLTQAFVAGTNGGTTTFRNGPFGRRVQKSSALGMINYLYDGANLIEEVGNGGTGVGGYTHGGQMDEPLADQVAFLILTFLYYWKKTKAQRRRIDAGQER